MNNKILVTITTVAYNGEKTLNRAIESVLNQTYPNIEYIIKDGLSTDKTVEIAESYRKAFEDKGYIFKVVSSKDNGMYDAINQAIDMASGVLVGNVNSDDYFEPDAVEKMVKLFEETDYDLAYADLRVINGEKTFIKKAQLKKFATSRYWNHPTTFIRRSILVNEKYKTESMYDDYDLVLRLRSKGYKFAILNEVVSNFVFGGMSNKKSLKETIKRIKLKKRMYKNNGYRGLRYWFDSVLIEFAKLIF